MSLVSVTRSTQLLNCTSAIVLELQEKTIQYSHQSRLQTGELHELLRKPMNIHHVLQTCTMITGGGGIPPLPTHAQTVDTRPYLFSSIGLGTRLATKHIEELRSKDKLTSNSRFSRWYPVTITEMEGFFAAILDMGLIEMPSIEDYWSTAWVTKTAFFSRVFTRDRFEAIFWLLHLSHEEEGAVPAKRVDKVKPLIDLLLPRFLANYVPSQCLAVDETMVGFRGRFGPKQYMPKKPVKYGFKAFTLADSVEGYVLNVLLYTGSETLGFVNPEYNTLPIPAQVVVHLMEPFLQKGHHVWTDRYYTRIPLAKKLKEEGTAFTGTAMKNRVGLPDAIRFGTRLSDDEIRAFRDDDNMLAVEWRAAKKKTSVIMVSTDDTAQTCEVTSRSTGNQKLLTSTISV